MGLKRFAMLLLMCGALMAAPAFTLSKSHPLQIATAQDATPAEKTAAKELQDYLKKLCGADCPVVAEKDVKAPAIYVGHTDFAKRQVGDMSKLGDEEWVIRTENGSLLITGGRPRGTLYGVYEFLERQGIVWADETTEYVPSQNAIVLDSPLSIQDKPAIMGRCVYSGFFAPSRAALMFYVRNKMNHQLGISETHGYSVAMGRPGGCHTFHAYTQPDWPDEWFAMDSSGKRPRSTSGSGPGQLCLTNPDLRKAMVARLKSFIEADRKGKSPDAWPRIYDISHNDCNGYCLCPNCKAIADREGSYSGPMLEFINYIADAIAKDYPEILVQTFAYTWTLDAPKTIKPAKNVMMRVCKLGCEFYPSGKADTQFPNTHPRNKDYMDNFSKWAAISDNLAVWDYWIIYTKGTRVPPYVNIQAIQQDIKFYSDNNVKTMFVECENPINTSFTYFKYWFGLKMMQNPDTPYDKLADAFCKAYYGPAAKPMRQYLDYLQERETAADVALGTSPMSFRNMRGNASGFNFTDAVRNALVQTLYSNATGAKIPDLLPYLDREFLLKANALLDEAETLAAENKVCLAHIRHERIPVDVAILGNIAKFSEAPPVGKLVKATPEALFERYAANVTERTRLYYASDVYIKKPETMKKCVNELESLRKGLFDDDKSLPPEFKDKCCLVYSAAMMTGDKVDDPDASGGKAVTFADGTSPNFHRIPFTMGVYNRTKRTFPLNMELKEAEIPQDGKYHWYKLGRCPIEATTVVWAHWSWRFQTLIDGAFETTDGDNTWDVNVSLKLTGKPYIKGSEEPPKVLIDKVILTK